MPEKKISNTIRESRGRQLSKKEDTKGTRDPELAQKSDRASLRAYRKDVEGRYWGNSKKNLQESRGVSRYIRHKDGSIGLKKVIPEKELTLQEKLIQAVRHKQAAEFKSQVYKILVEEMVKKDKADRSSRFHKEIVEPQVKEAVSILESKGYKIDSAGCWGTNGGYQNIYGDFKFNEKTLNELEKLGVLAGQNHQGISFIRFQPDEFSLDSVTAKWLQIAACLPDKRETKKPGNTFLDFVRSEKLTQILDQKAKAYTGEIGAAAMLTVFKELYPSHEQVAKRLEEFINLFQSISKESKEKHPEKPSEAHEAYAAKAVMEKLTEKEKSAIEAFLDANYQKWGGKGQRLIRADLLFQDLLTFLEKSVKETNNKNNKENVEVSESAKKFNRILNIFVRLFQDGDMPQLFKGFINSKPNTQEYEAATKELNQVYQEYMKDDRVPTEKIPDYKTKVEDVAKKFNREHVD